jgi:hypothetical protein
VLRLPMVFLIRDIPTFIEKETMKERGREV